MNKKDVFLALCGLAFPALILFAIFGAVKSFATVEKYAYPVLFVWFAALIFPGLLTACFPKTRGWTAAIMITWSYAFGVYLWLNALAVTVALCGWFGAIIGLLAAGVGVFPIALVALGWHGEWNGFGLLMLNIVTFFGVRIFGFWLAKKCPDYVPGAL